MSVERDENIKLKMGEVYSRDEFLYRADALMAIEPEPSLLDPVIKRVEQMPEYGKICFRLDDDGVARPVYSLSRDLDE